MPALKRTIMIVGNGPIGAFAAAKIAQAAYVIRFNECRSFAEAPGRTDVVAVSNTGRPGMGMVSSSSWRRHPAIRDASEIWCVRDPGKFEEMRGPLSLSHPDLHDFCDDYTDGFAAFAAETGKVHRILARSIHEHVEAQLAALDPPPYVVPSSGVVVIAAVLQRFQDHAVALAGFSHQGWEWHPFAAERRLVDALATAGRLQRFGHDAADDQSSAGTSVAGRPITAAEMMREQAASGSHRSLG
jgi:hypothetical protein